MAAESSATHGVKAGRGPNEVDGGGRSEGRQKVWSTAKNSDSVLLRMTPRLLIGGERETEELSTLDSAIFGPLRQSSILIT